MCKTITLLLLLITFCSAAFGSDGSAVNSQPQVIPPADGNLSFRADTDQTGYVYFQGQVMATGLLAAYWEVHYAEAEPTSLQKAQPVRALYLRFYPDAHSQSQLPSFFSPSGKTVRHQRLFAYRDEGVENETGTLISAYSEHDMKDIEELMEHFSYVPGSFLTYKEGVALQPVEITLDRLLSFTEADHHFLYGKIQTLKSLSATDYFLTQIPDSDTGSFLGKPWVEMLYSPGPLLIRETPDHDGKLVLELPAGSSELRKVRTADENWILVETASPEGRDIRGYVKKSELFPVN